MTAASFSMLGCRVTDIGMSKGQMVDIAAALMMLIAEVDANESAEAKSIRERVTASTMRRVGYSDDEIVSELGYLPEPFGSLP